MYCYVRFIKRYLISFIKNSYSIIKYNTKGRILGRPKHIQGMKNIHIGIRTTIDKGCRLDCYRSSNKISKIDIGKNCMIGFCCTFLSAGNLTIGDEVLIASNVFITNENHGIDPSKGNYMFQTLSANDVVIENNCWIGENVSILPGVHIGKWCVIGANSVVVKSIEDYCMAVGSPAKVIKKFNLKTQKWERV